MHWLPILAAGSLRSRCRQGLFLLRAVRKGSVPGLSPWLIDDRLLPVSLHTVFPLRVSVSVSKFLFFTSHTRLGLNSTDLLLTNYTCSNPVSKEGHMLRLGFQHMNFGWGGMKIQHRTAIIPYWPPEERRCSRKNR